MTNEEILKKWCNKDATCIRDELSDDAELCCSDCKIIVTNFLEWYENEKRKESCTWSHYSEGEFYHELNTSCGENYTFDDPPVNDPAFKYCNKCGKQIRIKEISFYNETETEKKKE